MAIAWTTARKHCVYKEKPQGGKTLPHGLCGGAVFYDVYTNLAGVLYFLRHCSINSRIRAMASRWLLAAIAAR